MSDAQPPTPDFTAIDAETFAGLIATSSDEQIAQGIKGPQRKQVLDEIFNRMAEHTEPERIKGQSAVIHFKILDRPDGGYDHYEVVIEGGEVEVTDSPSREPRVTLRLGPVEFLKLASGKESGPAMFMTGRLRIEGDLLYSAQLTSLFRIPRAAQP